MRYGSKVQQKKRLKKLSEESFPVFGQGGAYYDEDKGRYVRYYGTPGRKKTLKKISRKKIRKIKEVDGTLPQHNDAKKEYDYEWNLD